MHKSLDSSSWSYVAFPLTQPQSPTRKDLAEQFCQANHRLAEALHQHVALFEGQCRAGCSSAIGLNQPEPMRLELMSIAAVIFISRFASAQLNSVSWQILFTISKLDEIGPCLHAVRNIPTEVLRLPSLSSEAKPLIKLINALTKVKQPHAWLKNEAPPQCHPLPCSLISTPA